MDNLQNSECLVQDGNSLLAVATEIPRTARKSPPTIAVYAEPLLSPTMTFVRAQALSLKSFSSVFVGPRRIWPGLELPEQRVAVIHENGGPCGKIKEIPFKVLGYAPWFFRRVQKFKPVIVHAHTGPAALTALPMARWLSVPLIVTFHGYDATVHEMYLRRANFRCAVYTHRKAVLQKGADLFIAVSKFIQQCIVEQGFEEKKTILHYIGIDTEFFAPDAQMKREPVVLFVASLHEGKGCEYVIRAMAEVQSALPETELVVIGSGPLRIELERLARERLRRYRFLGSQPPEAIRQWMNRARLFSVASVTAASGWTEAFGLVYAEAHAMGLPVASFASGGIPEAVEHGKTGLLAPEKDWRSLAENILVLLKDENLWNRMSAAGQMRVRTHFNLRKQTAKLEEIYRAVLAGSPVSKT